VDVDEGPPQSSSAPALWWMGFALACVAQVQMALSGLDVAGDPPGPNGIDEVVVGAWFVGFVLAMIGYVMSDAETRGAGGRRFDRPLFTRQPNHVAYGFFGWILALCGGLMAGVMAFLLVDARDAIWWASVLGGFGSPLVGLFASVIGTRRMPKTVPAKVEDPAALMRGLSAKRGNATGVRVVSTDARFALLDREGRTQEAWRTALRALLTAESYRGVTLSRDEMVSVLEDEAGPTERRVAAALALADATDADVAIRARVAAEGADERVRVVLTGALDGALDDVVLDEVIAEEKKQRSGG
jgi:hypothetical protein